MPSSLFPQRDPMSSMIESFSRFRQQMAGKDPQKLIDELIASGRMSREQYERLMQQAKQLSQMMK